jgi:PrtD family type I secretion system ABC transporter
MNNEGLQMRAYLARCRSYFLYAGLFSLFINLLTLTLPLFMLQVFDRVLTSRSLETLIMLVVVTVFSLVVLTLLDNLRSRVLLGAGVALDGMIGPAVVAGLLYRAALPQSGANAYASGLRDVAVLRGFLTGPSITALFDAPWVPVYAAVIFLFHPLLGWTSVAAASLIFLLGYVNEMVTHSPLARVNQRARAASRHIDISLRNSDLVVTLGMVPQITQRFLGMNDAVIDQLLLASLRGGLIGALTRFVRMTVQVAMLAVGAWLVIHDHISLGVMMAGTILLARALAPVETSIVTWKGFVEARESWKRLDLLLSQSQMRAPAEVEVPVEHGALEVDGVAFAVPGSDRPILRGVHFTLASGESLGVIGPSAAGKTTLARILAGTWRPTAGTVRFAGADVSVWPREQLGPHIGYLPQDVELFPGTVAENIARMGQVDADLVIDAAKRAHAHDLILRLPNGYETEIGEAGAILSWGQRQRVAMARALYGRPRLVILDEPNAHLDAAGESALVEALQGLRAAGVMVVVISHRPSLLSGVDRILVLREGQIEALGGSNEVLARYAGIARFNPPPTPVMGLVQER